MNLFFDWSGTLADDKKLSFNLTNNCLAHFGFKKIDFKTYSRDFKIPVEGFYEKYCPGIPISKIDIKYFEFYKKETKKINLFKGFADYVPIWAHSHKLHIISTLDSHAIDNSLQEMGLRKYFKNIEGMCRDKSKIYINLVKKEKLNKNECLVIGDMPHDILSAKKAGLPCAAVSYGYSSPQTLKKLSPDYFIKNSGDLNDILEKMQQAQNWKWPLVTVGGLIFNEKKEVLIIKTEKWSNLYGTPGGKVDYGETLEAAFKREIKEETGYHIKNIKYVFYQDCINHPEFYKPRHFVLMNYIAYMKSGSLKTNYESQDALWVPFNEVSTYPLNEPTEKLVRELNMRKKEFNLL